MNKKLIDDLANQKCAVIHDGTLDELKTVLRVAFPNSNQLPGGMNRYYYRHNSNPLLFDWGTIECLFPAYSVKEFLKEEFVWGEDIEYRAIDRINGVNVDNWIGGYKYVGVDPFYSERHLIVHNTGNPKCVITTYFRKAISIKEVTLKEVAEKFGVTVEQIRIKE